MAIQIPDSLYSAGNVKLDSTPSVNFYRQIEAERRAKQDAIDDYMRGLRGKVTPAGMRVGDLPAFDAMRKKWQDFGIQNRERIARDPQARSQFESMAQDLMSFAEESKAEEAAKKPVVELFTDPTKREKVRPEVFTMIGEHDKPLYKLDESGNYVRDYSRKRLDYTSNLFKEPQFDFQKEYKGWVADAKPSEVIELDKPYTDKQTGMVFFPAKEKYNKEQIAQVGRNAIRAVKDDENKLQYYADRMAGISQKEYEQLDNIYRKYYNEPIGTSPEKLAAAEAAVAAEQSGRDLKPVSKLDYEKRKEDRINNIYLNDALIRGRKTAPTNEDLGNYDVFGKYEPKYSKKEIKQRTGFLKSENKTITIIPASEVDVNDKKLIGEVPPVNDNGEKYYIVRDDGDWEGKNGQVISRANAARKNMDATSLNEVKRGRLSEDIVPNQNVRTPKDIQKTKMQVKPTGASGISWK